LFLPAAVVIYIADKFLGGFLEELGADTSKALKEAIKHLFNDLKDHKIAWTVAKPLDAEHRPILSVPLSIEVQQFHQVEATTTFLFLAKMDQSSIIPALEGLPKAVSKAKLQILRQAELTLDLHHELEKSQTDAALEIESEYLTTAPGRIFAYSGERNEWVDIEMELKSSEPRQ